jgi:hypothetical protein
VSYRLFILLHCPQYNATVTKNDGYSYTSRPVLSLYFYNESCEKMAADLIIMYCCTFTECSAPQPCRINTFCYKPCDIIRPSFVSKPPDCWFWQRSKPAVGNILNMISYISKEQGWRGRYSDWLRAGRPRGWSSSPGRVKNFSHVVQTDPGA